MRETARQDQREKTQSPISSGRRFYRPKARLTHENSSRVGTAWKENTGLACILYWYDADTDHPYFRSSGKAVKIDRGHYTCPKCHEVVRIDTRGFAFCQCQVFNDGVTKPEKQNLVQNMLSKRTKHFIKRLAY